ncbi:PDR/VanB family oxidoreductase [Comamonas endophytica]|uniref:PDR/VanB family oxidoreductase n=1 Tax=Comamonas endophytica TaxID=2949090 RepID=A0ABY6GFX1_9BURK|nr:MULTISPECIES: PDR/VanB family oxidoreductase [unclassified Acidovorax]MCD2513283.1 PDR/VanB family oxidoreductase [Acidovorax sp. D4N7]UYG53374.1 PDR/VanB family oxidoreductase [Acidovorax sp. 5MLIR]
MSSNTLQALVHQLRHEAVGIVSIELRPLAPATGFAQAVEAGAHIDLHLAEGLVRSYSLVNPGESHRYVVAVTLDRASRGGSRHVHERLRVGQTIAIGAPRNHFALQEAAPRSVLLAGGIGITPIYAMAQRLVALGRPAHLIYCAASREGAAFVSEIGALAAASQGLLTVDWHFRSERGVRPALDQLLAAQPADAHFYCCGPQSMLDDYERACAARDPAQVHLERFGAGPRSPDQTPGEGYCVELRRSGKAVHVAPGVALLDALIDAGLNPDYSCREGVCGACEVKVISGDVEHRDLILTKQEQAANRSMMICVSGCRSGTLVLDC